MNEIDLHLGDEDVSSALIDYSRKWKSKWEKVILNRKLSHYSYIASKHFPSLIVILILLFLIIGPLFYHSDRNFDRKLPHIIANTSIISSDAKIINSCSSTPNSEDISCNEIINKVENENLEVLVAEIPSLLNSLINEQHSNDLVSSILELTTDKIDHNYQFESNNITESSFNNVDYVTNQNFLEFGYENIMGENGSRMDVFNPSLSLSSPLSCSECAKVSMPAPSQYMPVIESQTIPINDTKTIHPTYPVIITAIETPSMSMQLQVAAMKNIKTTIHETKEELEEAQSSILSLTNSVNSLREHFHAMNNSTNNSNCNCETLNNRNCFVYLNQSVIEIKKSFTGKYELLQLQALNLNEKYNNLSSDYRYNYATLFQNNQELTQRISFLKSEIKNLIITKDSYFSLKDKYLSLHALNEQLLNTSSVIPVQLSRAREYLTRIEKLKVTQIEEIKKSNIQSQVFAQQLQQYCSVDSISNIIDDILPKESTSTHSCPTRVDIEEKEIKHNESVRIEYVHVTKVDVKNIFVPVFTTNVAKLSLNAQVVPSLTSDTYSSTASRTLTSRSLRYLQDNVLAMSTSLLSSIFSSMIFMPSTGIGLGRIDYSAPTPNDALSDDLSIGSCWPFQGSKGTFTIKLSKPMEIVAISIDHLDIEDSKKIGDNNDNKNIDRSSAPKEFEVFAALNIENKFKTLLSGSYSIEANKSASQMFMINSNDNKSELGQEDMKVQYISLRIYSNHGNVDYTCLYGFRVHSIRAHAG